MIGPTVAAIGYILVLFAVAVSIARRLGTTEPLVDAPPLVRAALGGLALGGPWLLYWADLLPVADGATAHAVVLTAVMVLWLSAERLVGVTDQGGAGAC